MYKGWALEFIHFWNIGYENKVLQLMSAWLSLENFCKSTFFHKLEIMQTLF